MLAGNSLPSLSQGIRHFWAPFWLYFLSVGTTSASADFGLELHPFMLFDKVCTGRFRLLADGGLDRNARIVYPQTAEYLFSGLGHTPESR